MIEVKNLFKSYDGEFVLNDVSARFEPGKCNLIIGRSGSGKTVLLKSIGMIIVVQMCNKRFFCFMRIKKWQVILLTVYVTL